MALVTPSTGFILDSLHAFGLDDTERTWVRSKAIATEIVALVVLFVVLQSADALRLTGGVLALAAIILLLPVVGEAKHPVPLEQSVLEAVSAGR